MKLLTFLIIFLWISFQNIPVGYWIDPLPIWINEPCDKVWYYISNWTYNYNYTSSEMTHGDYGLVNIECIKKSNLWNNWLFLWNDNEYLLSDRWFFYNWKWLFYFKLIEKYLFLTLLTWIFYLCLYFFYKKIYSIKENKLIRRTTFLINILLLLFLSIPLLIPIYELIPIERVWHSSSTHYFFDYQIIYFLILTFLLSFIKIWIISKNNELNFTKIKLPISILVLLFLLYWIAELFTSINHWFLQVSIFLYIWYLFTFIIFILFILQIKSIKDIIIKTSIVEKIILIYICILFIVNITPSTIFFFWAW